MDMKIGVLSDTHMDSPTPLFERVVRHHFRNADMILHAGDIHSLSVLEALNGWEVHAVSGNCDPPEIREKFPREEIITIDKFRIGLIHGWGVPLGIRKRVAGCFEGVDCIVFGHSHWAMNCQRDGVLFFNPGSLKGGLFSLWRKSIGVLTIQKDIRGEIILL